jgi:tight adherence protein C
MNPLWLALVVAALTFLGLFGVTIALSGGMSAVEQRIRLLRRDERQGTATTWRERVEPLRSAATQLGRAIPRSPSELSRMERKLTAAGFRRPESVYIFHGIQAALAVVLLLAFVAGGQFQSNPLLFGVLAAFAGAAVPDAALAHLVSSRRLEIQLGLPDALDLQVVAVEAGLGLDQALMRISQELQKAHPALCDELRQYGLETNAGKSRVEALRNLGARSEAPDLKALVAVLIQTDRFGTSIADSLRVFSDSLRTKRRQRAEEAAAKLPVKMVLPLFLFIFPATIVVVLGPAIVQIVRELLPTLAGGGR